MTLEYSLTTGQKCPQRLLDLGRCSSGRGRYSGSYSGMECSVKLGSGLGS